MIVNQTIYAVTHIRCRQSGSGNRREELITQQWFDSLADAEHFFQELHRGAAVFSGGLTETVREWEIKRLYQKRLSQVAQAILAADPHHHPQRLAVELDLQASAGVLLKEEPTEMIRDNLEPGCR